MPSVYRATFFLSETMYDSKERPYHLGEQLVAPAELVRQGVKTPAAMVIYGATGLAANKLHKNVYFLGRETMEGGLILTVISEADAAEACATIDVKLADVPVVPLREKDPSLSRSRRLARNNDISVTAVAPAPDAVVASDPSAVF